MEKVMYCDLRQVSAEVDSEDEALLDMFSGRREADNLILALDGVGIRLLSKNHLFAVKLVAELEQEQLRREAEREDMEKARKLQRFQERRERHREAKRKHREDIIRAVVMALTWGTVAVCGGAILWGYGDPMKNLAVIEVLILASLCAEMLRRRGMDNG